MDFYKRRNLRGCTVFGNNLFTSCRSRILRRCTGSGHLCTSFLDQHLVRTGKISSSEVQKCHPLFWCLCKFEVVILKLLIRKPTSGDQSLNYSKRGSKRIEDCHFVYADRMYRLDYKKLHSFLSFSFF